MLKRLLSYFCPLPIHSQNSNISKRLEVNYTNGKYVLDSKSTNYSFGNLQKVLYAGLKSIGIARIRTMQNCLVLGVGAGSVLHTLRNDIRFQGPITAVELDEEVIRLGRKYFEFDQLENIDLQITDAFDFVLRNQKRFDLIVIDIFQDSEMPAFLYQDFFIKHLKLSLSSNGCMLFNTIIVEASQVERNTAYCTHFTEPLYRVERLRNIDRFNELVVVYANPSN